MASPSETSPDGSRPSSVTAPEAALAAACVLTDAVKTATALSPLERTEQLIEIAREWRQLALALAQNQAMTPRPRDDDR